jgi:aspartyl-tRNA(Asn)/glutamyl-tRNA(Gln) amidotransferase subunit C
VAVTPDDVRHVAFLARLELPDDRLQPLVAELNGILAHMDVLSAVPIPADAAVGGLPPAATPLRDDAAPSLALARRREDIAPEMRDGFFLVPRLATHDEGRTAP